MAKIARGRGQKILGVFFGRGGGRSIVLNPDDQKSDILTVLVIWISIL